MKAERIKFLADLKAYGIENNIPNVSENTAKMLHFLVSMKKAKSLLEIGCANGYSTIWLADAMEQNGGKMFTCDVSEPSFLQAVENIKTLGLDSIVEMQFGDAKEIFKESTKSFDIIFIDARKKHYHIFWELAKKMLNENGLIIIDDVIKFPEKTQEFHDTMEKEKDWEKVIIPVDGDDGVMLVQKK